MRILAGSVTSLTFTALLTVFDIPVFVCLSVCVAISEYVVCPESLTLHEVFYYNEVSELRRRVCAAPRAAIQQALMKPYNYLKVGNFMSTNST